MAVPKVHSDWQEKDISYLAIHNHSVSDHLRWHCAHIFLLSQNLIESKLLIGKTKPEVRQLLGNDSAGADSTDVWGIDLGYRPELFNIDPSVLQIVFGSNHVIHVEQIH